MRMTPDEKPDYGRIAFEANWEAWPPREQYVAWENLTQSARDGWTKIADTLWREFERQYPVRLSAKSPEVQSFFEENDKAMVDMLLHGAAAVKCVPLDEIVIEREDDGK